MASGNFWGGFAKTGPSKLLSDYYMSGEKELAEDYATGTAVTEREAQSSIDSYKDAATGLDNPDDPRFAHLTPEQRAQAAAVYKQAAVTGSKIHLGRGDGREGTAFDAAPTPEQTRMAGQEAQIRGLYLRGKSKDALSMESQLQGLKTGQQQSKALGLAIEAAERAAAIDTAQQTIMTDVKNMSSILYNPEHKDYKTTLAKVVKAYSDSNDPKHGGKAVAQLVTNPHTGKPMIAHYPEEGGGPPQMVPITPELTQQMIDGYAENALSHTSVAAFAANLKEKTRKGEVARTRALQERGVDIQAQAATDARTSRQQTYDLQVKQFGAVAVHNQKMYDQAKRAADLAETRFGKDSPDHIEAKAKADEITAFSDGMTSLTTMMSDREDPAKVHALALQVAVRTPKDKMVGEEVYNPTTGMTTKTSVSPIMKKVSEYTKIYADGKTEELQGKYDPKVKITVVPGPGGKVGYVSSKSGTVYKTEAEMVKAENIQLAPALGRARPTGNSGGFFGASHQAPRVGGSGGAPIIGRDTQNRGVGLSPELRQLTQMKDATEVALQNPDLDTKQKQALSLQLQQIMQKLGTLGRP